MVVKLFEEQALGTNTLGVKRFKVQALGPNTQNSLLVRNARQDKVL
jgi:hypothetical protein